MREVFLRVHFAKQHFQHQTAARATATAAAGLRQSTPLVARSVLTATG